MPRQTTTLHVRELDCDAEVRILQKALRSVAANATSRNDSDASDEPLRFDVVNRRVTVSHDSESTTPESLVALVKSVGMTASIVGPAHTSDSSGSACRDGACETDAADSADADDARPAWLLYGPFVLSGALAAACEVLYFAGVPETSWPIVSMSIASMALGGRETFYKGWIALRTMTLNINFLMSVAVIGGAFIGAWPEIALVVFLFGLAELIEKKALDRAKCRPGTDGLGAG